jgi:hypothetical protein
VNLYGWQLVVGGLALLLYLVLVLWTASAYIGVANEHWLRAHQYALNGRLQALDIEGAPGDAASAQDLTAGIRSLLPEDDSAKPRSERLKLRARLRPSGWIGSCDIAEWVQLHEAQRLEVGLLSEQAVLARFARAMGQVNELPTARQAAWQQRWTELQGVSSAGREGPAAASVWRAELSQLLAELFNSRDSVYSQLVSLYGKAGWLVAAAFLPIVVLLAGGYGMVVLAGFVGGLVSRMQRLVYGRGRPTAYGTSWVPLYLAPLLGGLAAWAGLHLLALLQLVKIIDLTSIFRPGEDFRGAPPIGVLGLAVLLGFSERFFNRIGDQAEDVIGKTMENTVATSGSPVPSVIDLREDATETSEAGADGAHNRP